MVQRPARPIDADVDLHVPADRQELRGHPASVLLAISAGGVLGALARYALTTARPHAAGHFPWATLLVNVSGCALIGVLMVIVTDVLANRRLLRPFLGVGVLGGYTTFSTYVVDIRQTAAAGAPGTALAYLVVTVVGAVLAVWAGTAVTARLLRRTARERVPR